MSDLPPGYAQCDPVLQINPPYRAIYDCVSYITRATGSHWHASIPVPDKPDFAEIDIRVTLPKEIADKFRLYSIKRVTRADDPAGGKFNTFSLTYDGTPSLGDCKPAPAQCIVERAVSARVYYR